MNRSFIEPPQRFHMPNPADAGTVQKIWKVVDVFDDILNNLGHRW